MTDEEFIRDAFKTEFITPGSVSSYQEEQAKIQRNYALTAFLSLVACAGIFSFSLMNYLENKRSQTTYTQEDLDQIRERGWEKEFKKRKARTDNLEAELDDMLVYPKKDPSVNEMLVNYTIWKDIEVDCSWMHRIEKNTKLKNSIISGESKVPKTKVDNHKASLYISVALETERRLKNVFVSV